jgi:predicted TIM-barrel fold metal-dependent hydrolase
MFDMVTGALGDGCLMFGSDYPHFESWFPNSIDKILEWPSVAGDKAKKLFWENANRCFKQT